jgi:serine/threonine protein kinase/tetratricopeptide (TPR) repeat protein
VTPERWQKIESIFQSAVEIAPDERRKYIFEQCGADEELKREVERLIADLDSAKSFIESPMWQNSDFLSSFAQKELTFFKESVPENDPANQMIGRRVGVYELKKELGRGGMGAVYLATRADGEFFKQVAVKLIKRGMDSDFIVKRFRRERQILAGLNHPNIAQLYDGGTTEEGLPYFVMEYVKGEPLYHYCDKRKLNVRERLRIFREIASAVAAAHEQQVIHRDIKPGNILVTKEGAPKLLDFGIAKILDPDLIHESINPTASMVRLMTTEYASPEQVRGGEITPASDVYALGVLLYELLTGHRPLDFSGKPAHEISRLICEEKPPLPSEIVGRAKNLLPAYVYQKLAPEQIAELRGESLENLQNLLHGSLDRIIMQALRKTPAERYKTVAEFLTDIARFVEGEEITARPVSANFSKTENTGENEKPTGGKSIAVLPLKILHAPAEDDTGEKFLGIGLADALITRLSGVQRFIVRPTSSVLRYGEGDFDSFAAGRDLNVEFVLDGNVLRAGNRIRISIQLLNVAEQSTVWAERFDEDFTDVLSLEDRISTRVAESLVPRLTENEREHLAKRGTDDPKAFEAYLRGRYHWNTFTEEGFRQAIVSYQKAIEFDPNYALAYAGIADYYVWLGVYGVLSPKQVYPPAKEAARRAIGIDNELAEAYAGLGFALLCGDFNWTESEKYNLRAIELNPNYAVAHIWYSFTLFTEARFEEGIWHSRRAIELDPMTYHNHHTLAWGLYFARRFDEAIVQIQSIIERFPAYGLAYFSRSWFLRFTGRHDEALKDSRRAIELSGDSLFVLLGHAQALAAAGKRSEALETLKEIEARSPAHYVSYYQVALIYAYLKEKEKTLAALEKAFADGEGWLIWLGVEPVLDFLRDEPRFVKLMEITGNPLLKSAKDGFSEAKTSEPKSVSSAPAETNKAEIKKVEKQSNANYKIPLIVGAIILILLIVFFMLSQK